MQQENEVTLESALEIAKDYHLNGNLKAAEITYNDILNAFPDDFSSLHYLGILAYQRDAPKEGLVFLKKALEINDTNAETFNAYAVTLEITGQLDAALEQWQKALEINPNFVDALSNYGNALWKNKEFGKAQEACEKALEINPDFHDALINLGNALMSQNMHDQAVEQWQKALTINPNHASAHINIGNSLRELGQITKSEEHCLKALELSPDNPIALLNLGNAVRDQGRYEEAEKIYKQATDIQPDSALSHNNLATVLICTERYDEALVATRYALAFDPESVTAYGTQAVALRELNRLREAEKAARKALSLAPDSVEARIDLADILSLESNFHEAAELFDEAMELQPDSPRLYIKLSSALDRAHRTDEAIEVIKKAVEVNPEMPEAYWVMGTIYFMSNDIENAEKALDKAIELKPDFTHALASKAEILQSLGKMKESEQFIREALRLNEISPNLYYSLSNTKTFEKDGPEFKAMEDMLLDSQKVTKQDRAILHYALFRSYEKIKDYEKAYPHLKKGADIKSGFVTHDEERQHNLFSSIQTTFSKDNVKKITNSGCDSDVPIFILGMPRSGTTLTEQIISSHPDVYGAGELSISAAAEREVGVVNNDRAKEWGEYYVDKMRNINEETQKAKKITDKMPGNYAKLGQLILALPNAKIIHCRRNPMDTCLSCYKQLFSRGHEWSYNWDEMTKHYEEYHNLMAHWRQVFPDKFIDIDYEDTINDFENQARKLIDYVGLEWNDACLTPHKSKRSVLTASKAQVIKPIYNTSIEAWKRYEDELTPMAEQLEKFARK